MNRRISMCTILVVLALFGVWSVHSVGQDLFDDSAADTGTSDGTPEDSFAGEDSGDIFDDGSPDEAQDDLFIDGISDDELAAGDLDLRHGASDDVPGDETLQLDVVDLAADSDVEMEEVESVIDLNVDDGGLYNLTVFPTNAARHTRQRIARLQQTVLQAYMQTKDKSTRDKLVSRLSTSVSEEFDVRQKERGNELKALERELSRLRSIHQQRQREKNTIVRNRVRQLIRDKEGLGWGSEGVSRRSR